MAFKAGDLIRDRVTGQLSVVKAAYLKRGRQRINISHVNRPGVTINGLRADAFELVPGEGGEGPA